MFVIESVVMFLRRVERRKNGKTHLYWNIVENRRLADGRVVQRHVYYLGEINSSQAEGNYPPLTRDGLVRPIGLV